MTRRFGGAALTTVIALIAFLSGLDAAQAQPHDLAIQNVTIVDVVDGSLRAGQTILIQGNRIAAIGEAQEFEVRQGAEVLDGAGGYLIPGLWDMHAHASRGGRAPRFWPLFLAHGVTGIRDMGSYADSLLYWRARSKQPDVTAPRIEITSPSLTGDSPPPLPGMGGPFEIHVADAASAVTVVDSLGERGIDAIKVYDGLPRDAYFAVAERTRERGMSFIGHAPLSVSLIEASDAGQKSFEHVADVWASCLAGGRTALANFAWASAQHGPASDSALTARERLVGSLAFSEPDPAECGPLLERMRANDTWLSPTLTVMLSELQPRHFDGDPRLRWIPGTIRERWDARPRMPAEQEAAIGRQMLTNAEKTVAIAHEAGVGILAGTDASDMPYIFAGSSLHDELFMYVEAGLTPLEALRTATINPARFLGRADEFGTVEEGKLADLVLLDANPLEDITNTQRIRSVIADGRLYRRADLDAMLAEAEQTQDSSPLARVEALDLDTAQVGRVTAYFDPADQERAVELATLSQEAARFFDRKLAISFDFGVAALPPELWFEPIPGIPYAIPWASVRERLLFVPSSLEEGLLVRGRSTMTERRRVVDFVSLHEYGHLATKEYFHPADERDGLPISWFNELLPNIFAYAFIASRDPEWAAASKQMWLDVIKSREPAVLSLEWEFMNDLPPRELARTYGWYQNLLNLRAAELYEEHGLDFLRMAKEQLAWDEAGDWTTESLLTSLEEISPGFEAWARDLENGDYLPRDEN